MQNDENNGADPQADSSKPSVSLLSSIFARIRSMFCRRRKPSPLVSPRSEEACRTPPLHRIEEEAQREDEEAEEEELPLEEMLVDSSDTHIADSSHAKPGSTSPPHKAPELDPIIPQASVAESQSPSSIPQGRKRPEPEGELMALLRGSAPKRVDSSVVLGAHGENLMEPPMRRAQSDQREFLAARGVVSRVEKEIEQRERQRTGEKNADLARCLRDEMQKIEEEIVRRVSEQLIGKSKAKAQRKAAEKENARRRKRKNCQVQNEDYDDEEAIEVSEEADSCQAEKAAAEVEVNVEEEPELEREREEAESEAQISREISSPPMRDSGLAPYPVVSSILVQDPFSVPKEPRAEPPKSAPENKKIPAAVSLASSAKSLMEMAVNAPLLAPHAVEVRKPIGLLFAGAESTEQHEQKKESPTAKNVIFEPVRTATRLFGGDSIFGVHDPAVVQSSGSSLFMLSGKDTSQQQNK